MILNKMKKSSSEVNKKEFFYVNCDVLKSDQERKIFLESVGFTCSNEFGKSFTYIRIFDLKEEATAFIKNNTKRKP